MKRTVHIAGSTGSIGKQALDVLKLHSDEFELLGISANQGWAQLVRQAHEFHPRYVACNGGGNAEELPEGTELLTGDDATERLLAIPSDSVVLGVSGIAALKPLLSAIPNTKRVAIANKESLVCGGLLVDAALKRYGTALLPVDSEQSAIFQCLQNGRETEVQRLILTCSGGPFFGKRQEELSDVSVSDVLKHPTWNMGRKITLDSATLFNKGLEVIEAARLFHMRADRISVLIHPQSVVHSMVEYTDGTVMANLSLPDMRLPIQYALTYPERRPSPCKPLAPEQIGSLTFFAAEPKDYPALRLSFDALRREQGYPVVYNGANEQAAQLFFDGRIRFTDIARCVEAAMQAHRPAEMDSLAVIEQTDVWAKSFTERYAATHITL